MKSEVIYNNEPEITNYPCLKHPPTPIPKGHFNGIVLFISPGKGTVVGYLNSTGPKPYTIGAHSDCWTEQDMIPFTGKVELSN